MDVTSLYTNIPQKEGTEIVCTAYNNYCESEPPIPTKYVRAMLTLILEENSFKFNKKHFLQSCGTAMGTKAAVAFANIFMAKIENQILENSEVKPLEWVRFVDDIACFWDATKDEVVQFVQKEKPIPPDY